MEKLFYPVGIACFILTTFGRITLLAISYKHLSVSRFYMIYQLIIMIASMFLPIDHGSVHNVLVMCLVTIYFLAFAIDFWPNSIAVFITQAFCGFIVRPLIYEEELTG